MAFFSNIDSALVAIYGDTPDSQIAKSITAFIPDREIRILTPQDHETLERAATHSMLIFIGLHGEGDANLRLGARLKDNRSVMADVVGFCLKDIGLTPIQVMGHGFHSCITLSDSKTPDFKNFLVQKIITGNRRLASLIQEEEYRRVCDALSCAPASMIIFDQDKRATFVSDHYYRAYPKIAPRLIRGLSVYDAFDMMMKEEKIPVHDERYARLQQFWHNLTGSIEFSLDSGTVYRLKAVHLPSRRGTVIMGQNISDYHQRNSELSQKLDKVNLNSEEVLATIQAVVSDFEKPFEALASEVEQLRKAAKKDFDFANADSALKAMKSLFKQAQKLSKAKR
jgi:hypothetical protein